MIERTLSKTPKKVEWQARLTTEHMFSILEAMEALTERQEKVLEFISSFLEKMKMPPSVREIQSHFGFESTNAVTDHLAQLERKGYLKRRPRVSRGIELISKSISFHPNVVNVPLVGQVAAGIPTLAEENIEGYFHLDKTFIRGDGPAWPAGRHFFLKVKGESMEDAGIRDGDLILVQKTEKAETGEIIVAYLEGEATVKYFSNRRGVIELCPANPSFSPIKITKEKYPDFKVLGKVKAVLRIL